ncbi:dTMP kinase [Anaplasmataceae bacterium AB001_6]|nr:dTMP kinase [Anaplasmataceae bacterium AB001_6]
MFITFEGVSGAGKTLQSEILYNKIKDVNDKVVFTREPGGTQYAEKIRDLVLQGNVKYPESELLMFMAARYEHCMDVICPTIEAGGIVICDRFIDSTIAYQGYTKGISITKIKKLHNIIFEKYKNYISPDLTVILDISVDKMKERLEKRYGNIADKSKMKSKDSFHYNFFVHRRIWAAYQDLSRNRKRYKLISSDSKSIEEVASIIENLVKEKFPKIVFA